LSAPELAAYFSNIAAPAGMNDASRANFEIAFAEREAAKRAETANSVDPSSDPNSPPSPDPSPRGGPSTQAGKARSAKNLFKHGLSSGFNHFRLLSSEDPAEYAELVSDIRAQFRPGSRPEVHKLEDMAQAWWLQRLDAQLASLREVQHRLQETMSGSAARSALASFLLERQSRDGEIWPRKGNPPARHYPGIWLDSRALPSPMAAMHSISTRAGGVSRWTSLLAEPEELVAIRALQRGTFTGRPVGSPEFVGRLEEELGRPLATRKGGRKQAASAAITGR